MENYKQGLGLARNQDFTKVKDLNQKLNSFYITTGIWGGAHGRHRLWKFGNVSVLGENFLFVWTVT